MMAGRSIARIRCRRLVASI